MTLTLPSGRAGRALAVALLAGVAAAGWFAGAAPLAARYGQREEALLRRQALHRRMTAVAADLPALQLAVAAAPQPAGSAPTLLDGGTDAVAGAALQEMLRDMAGQAGATLFSVETLPASAGGAYRRIGLRLSLAARWPVLLQMLAAIERARPLMAVDDLELRRTQIDTGEEEALISAALTVYAFRDGAEPRRAP